MVIECKTSRSTWISTETDNCFVVGNSRIRCLDVNVLPFKRYRVSKIWCVFQWQLASSLLLLDDGVTTSLTGKLLVAYTVFHMPEGISTECQLWQIGKKNSFTVTCQSWNKVEKQNIGMEIFQEAKYRTWTRVISWRSCPGWRSWSTSNSPIKLVRGGLRPPRTESVVKVTSTSWALNQVTNI